VHAIIHAIGSRATQVQKIITSGGGLSHLLVQNFQPLHENVERGHG